MSRTLQVEENYRIAANRNLLMRVCNSRPPAGMEFDAYRPLLSAIQAFFRSPPKPTLWAISPPGRAECTPLGGAPFLRFFLKTNHISINRLNGGTSTAWPPKRTENRAESSNVREEG